jgi:hypothetical protein
MPGEDVTKFVRTSTTLFEKLTPFRIFLDQGVLKQNGVKSGGREDGQRVLDRVNDRFYMMLKLVLGTIGPSVNAPNSCVRRYIHGAVSGDTVWSRPVLSAWTTAGTRSPRPRATAV